MAPKVMMKVKQVAAKAAPVAATVMAKTVKKSKKLSVLSSIKSTAVEPSKALAMVSKATVKASAQKAPTQKVVVKVRGVLKEVPAAKKSMKMMKAMKAQKTVMKSAMKSKRPVAMKTTITDKSALKAKQAMQRVKIEKKKAALKAKKDAKKAKIAEQKAAKKAKAEEKKAARKAKKQAEQDAKKEAAREAWETERAIQLVAKAEAREKAKAQKAAVARAMKEAKEKLAKDREAARQALLLEKQRADEQTKIFMMANPVETNAPPQAMEDETPVSEKDWADMSAKERMAVTTLGWTEATWTEGAEAPFARAWEVLTSAEQQAAALLGFSAADFGAVDDGEDEAQPMEQAVAALAPVGASLVMTTTTIPQPMPKAVMEVTVAIQAAQVVEEKSMEVVVESQPDMQADPSASRDAVVREEVSTETPKDQVTATKAQPDGADEAEEDAEDKEDSVAEEAGDEALAETQPADMQVDEVTTKKSSEDQEEHIEEQQEDDEEVEEDDVNEKESGSVAE